MKSLIKSTLPLLSLTLLIACGKAGSGANGPSGLLGQNEEIMADGSNINGIYAADLMPVNHNLHFKKVGTVAIQREGDSFSAHVRLKYGSKEVIHKQAIYTGRKCPNITDDKNGDAYIDIQEALGVIGQVTIPLDGNLNSQDEGKHIYPMGNSTTGAYSYDQSASFQRMFADLKERDTNPYDNIIKLAANDGLTFPGRIVVIHGLSRKVNLPETLTTVPGESVYESIPVACGVLWKAPSMPEEFISDGI